MSEDREDRENGRWTDEKRKKRLKKACRVTVSVCTVCVTRVCLVLWRVTRHGGHNRSSERHLLLAAATVARVPALLSSPVSHLLLLLFLLLTSHLFLLFPS